MGCSGIPTQKSCSGDCMKRCRKKDLEEVIFNESKKDDQTEGKNESQGKDQPVNRNGRDLKNYGYQDRAENKNAQNRDVEKCQEG